MNGQIFPLPRATDLENGGLPRDAVLPIGQMLIDSGRLTAANSQRILEHQKKTGLPFGEAGVSLRLLGEDDVRHALSMQFGHAWLPPAQASVELDAACRPDSAAVEQLRGLRSQLMLRWFDNDARQGALAIVSPGMGEGRTYIAANLAVLFSQLGKRTLLIDADLRRPRQHRIFGLAGRVGLSGMLAGRIGSEAISAIKSLPGLSVLPAGALPPNPQELLAKDSFTKLLSFWRSSYEVILLDTPAANTCADAGTVAARAGAALMLACRDRSSMSHIAQLADDLRQFGVTVVGSVFNGAPKS